MKIIWTFELGLNDKQLELIRDLGSIGSGSIQMKSLIRMHINWHAKFNFNKIPVVLIFCVSPDLLGSTQTLSINMASHIWNHIKHGSATLLTTLVYIQTMLLLRLCAVMGRIARVTVVCRRVRRGRSWKPDQRSTSPGARLRPQGRIQVSSFVDCVK